MPHPYALSSFLGTLVIIACVELAIMLVLPLNDWLHSLPRTLNAIMDVVLLLGMSAPLLWWLHLRPSQRQLDNTLRQQEQYANNILNNMHECVLLLDKNGIILYANPASMSLLGLRAEELIGHKAQQVIRHPDEQDDRRFCDAILHGRAMHDQEDTFLGAGGKRIPVSVVTSPLKQGDTIIGAVITFHDIYERQAFQQALQAREQRFRALFHGSNDAILVHPVMRSPHDKTHFVEANERASELLGYSHAELLAMSPLQLDAPGWPRNLPEVLKQIAHHGKALFETHHRHKDGSDIPVEINAQLFHFEDGDYIISVVRDIRARQALERQRQQADNNMRALLNAINESAFLIAPDGELLAINQTGAARLNITPQEVLGCNIFDLFPPPVAATRRQQMADVLTRKTDLVFEDSRQGRQFQNHLWPILNEQGEVERIAIFALDVTEQRQLLALSELMNSMHQLALKGSPLTEILQLVCEHTASLFKLDLVLVGSKEDTGNIRILHAAGPAHDYLHHIRDIGVRWDSSRLSQGPTGMALKTGRPQIMHRHDDSMQPWRQAMEQEGLMSVISLPLFLQGQAEAVMALYSSDDYAFANQNTINRLTIIADRVSMAMDMAHTQHQLTLLGSALSSANNAILITDRNGRIQWVNKALEALSGYNAKQLIGQNPRIFKSGHQDSSYYRHLWETISRGETWNSEVVEKRRDGQLYIVHQTITPIRDEQSNDITHFVSIQQDITLKKAQEERIYHMAHHDLLTGLPNRTLMTERLQQSILRAHRHHRPLAVLFMDLDKFKPVNDTYGHEAGDALLKQVAQRLLDGLRESDTVARLGGDEFVVILPDTTPEGVIEVAAKLVNTLQVPFELDRGQVQIGTSIGIALYPQDGDDWETLLGAADKAMYEAKKERNHWAAASPLIELSAED